MDLYAPADSKWRQVAGGDVFFLDWVIQPICWYLYYCAHILVSKRIQAKDFLSECLHLWLMCLHGFHRQ